MTKPTVFNYKQHEELRQAYKELLADNQQLTADNRKLRKEVGELKQLNDGYVKIIAKNQETNNKLMASVQKQTCDDLVSRADAIEAVVNMQDGSGQTYEFVREAIFALKALPSAVEVDRTSEWVAVRREEYEDLIANAVQAHGKWQRFNDEHGTYWTGCSNCKGDIPKDKYGIDIYTDFCPNCGADMRETK